MQIGDIYKNLTKEEYAELAIACNELGFIITHLEDGSYLIEGQPVIEILPTDEIRQLKAYLAETDYMVIKSMETGQSMETTYPEEFKKRMEARKKINELELQIEQQ